MGGGTVRDSTVPAAAGGAIAIGVAVPNVVRVTGVAARAARTRSPCRSGRRRRAPSSAGSRSPPSPPAGDRRYGRAAACRCRRSRYSIHRAGTSAIDRAGRPCPWSSTRRACRGGSGCCQRVPTAETAPKFPPWKTRTWLAATSTPSVFYGGGMTGAAGAACSGRNSITSAVTVIRGSENKTR